jgi:hypothetical protein
MNIFLRAKHWQLFVLTFGIPLVFNIIIITSLFSSLLRNPNPNPAMIFGYFKFFPLIMALYAGTLFGWQWSVAIGLQKLIPAGIKMKVTRFKIFFFIPLVYLLVILLLMAGFFSNVLNSSFDINSLPNDQTAQLFFGIFALIMPVHLFSMFCIFYCLYFVAKTYKTVELQREVLFSDFVLEFFLVWFYFIGVWIMQPKINKMIVRDTTGQIDT